jgi:hypothetical protein
VLFTACGCWAAAELRKLVNMASVRALSKQTFVKVSGFSNVRQSARCLYMYSPEPFHPIPDREPKWTTAEEAVSVLTSGTYVLDLEIWLRVDV